MDTDTEPSENVLLVPSCDNFQLPTRSWSCHRPISMPDTVAYSVCDLNKARTGLNVHKLVVFTVLKENSSTLCQAYLRGVKIKEYSIKTAAEGEEALQQTDDLRVCQGAGNATIFTPLPLSSNVVM